MRDKILQELNPMDLNRAVLLDSDPEEQELRPPTIRGPEDVRCLHDQVLVREVPLKVSAGGIALLPDTAERMMAAYVEKVGPGRMSEYGVRSEMSCQVGDVVYTVGRPVYPPIRIDNDERNVTYWLVRDRDLACAADGPALAEFRTQAAYQAQQAKSDISAA